MAPKRKLFINNSLISTTTIHQAAFQNVCFVLGLYTDLEPEGNSKKLIINFPRSDLETLYLTGQQKKLAASVKGHT